MTTTAEPQTAPNAKPVGRAMMSAVVASRYGGPDVLELRAVPLPTAGKGEVLVQVSVAGLSRAALHLLTGTPYLLRLAGFGLMRPKHPVGNEMAGIVVTVGEGVAGFAPGDEVFGYSMGTCAEFAVAKADKLAHKPPGLAMADAAALVDSGSTALQAVRDHAGVWAGQRVLVLGASGGVGSYAVQIAASLGASVTGTASAAKLDLVRSLGAAHVIDHHATDPLAVREPYDVIIDIGGNRPVKAMRRALAADGTLVIVGGEGGGNVTGGFQRQLLAPLRGLRGTQRLKTFVTTEHAASLDDLARMVLAGAVRPPIDRTHDLVDVADGLGRMAAGQIRGKDVVVVRPGSPVPPTS